MVRINLMKPVYLLDQHLIAEYNEILMLLGYVRLYPKINDIPQNFLLGKGHIKFFKNKLKYLQNRHNQLKQEMIKRSYNPKITIDLNEFNPVLCNDWKPENKDLDIIKERIYSKIKLKPEYYTYYKEHYDEKYYLNLTKNSTL